jgi:2-hydroxychromene-2-carboxylate isomerase
LLRLREKAERQRLAAGKPHQLHYFHQVDDPYSALAADVLPKFLARYQVELLPHVVGAPPDAAAPDRDRLVAYSRSDAQLLARHRGLSFEDPGHQPSARAVEQATALLVAAALSGRFAEQAGPVSARLWRGLGEQDLDTSRANAEQVSAHLEQANGLRQSLGHYLGAMFFYAGEWYWGIDRLGHLERRLQALGAQREGVSGLLFAADLDLDAPVALPDPPPIDFFFSLRSPYSAIAVPRVLALGRHTGAKVRLRYVLPMVMRGLAVPAAKRSYIARDTAREAFDRGIEFGRVNDPLGRPTLRGLALMAYAEKAGLGPEYLLSFMQGVWAEGLDAGSDRGLRRIVLRAGLDWDAAKLALQDESWREVAEANRLDMLQLGLWGVPSFHVRDQIVWGQDRLWAVQQELLAAKPASIDPP